MKPTEKVIPVDITTLTYQDRDIPLEAIEKLCIGNNQDIHIQINLNDYLPTATRARIDHQYSELIQRVTQAYRNYSKGNRFSDMNNQKLANTINSQINQAVISHLNAYIQNRQNKWVEVEYKQSQAPATDFLLKEHLKVHVRCYKKA